MRAPWQCGRINRIQFGRRPWVKDAISWFSQQGEEESSGVILMWPEPNTSVHIVRKADPVPSIKASRGDEPRKVYRLQNHLMTPLWTFQDRINDGFILCWGKSTGAVQDASSRPRQPDGFAKKGDLQSGQGACTKRIRGVEDIGVLSAGALTRARDVGQHGIE